MLKVAITRFLQHLIAQNTWANERLLPFAGKSLQCNIGFLREHLVILEDGQLAMAGETNLPDATITLTPSVLLRLMMQDESAKMDVNIAGDQHLAQGMAQVFANMRWDIEDDLSKVIGDIPANQLSEGAKHLASESKSATTNAIAMLTEYLQEEKPLLAKKMHVEKFNAEVDTLRAQLARAEKKFEKLNQRAQQLAEQTFNATNS
jgi:ubiquinone biosynthesis protein UbiJ